MTPTLEQILDETLYVLDLDKDYFLKNKESRKKEILEVKQIVSLIGQKYAYPQTTIGAFLGISHSAVCLHKNNAIFYYDHDKMFARNIDLILTPLKKYEQREVLLKGWVARSSVFNNCLQFFINEKPIRNGEYGIWQPNENSVVYDIPNEIFSFITWKDEPVGCEISIKLSNGQE